MADENSKQNESINSFPECYYDKKLSDFLGDKQTIKEVNKIFWNIVNRNVYSTMGVQPKKSFLFHGEKGTGKNRAVECIVGELIRQDLNVWVREYSIGSQGSVYVDGGSKKVQKFFDDSREILMPGTGIDCLVYVFDEVEQIMRSRGGSNNKEDDKRLTTLMMNLQRIYKSNDANFLFFMTNEPTLMDGASIRSERIDKDVKFILPDLNARTELFQYAIDQINGRVKNPIIQNYDAQRLAELSEGFNCADCAAIPERAVQEIIDGLEEKYMKIKGKIHANQKRLLEKIHDQRQRYGKTTKKKIGF